MKRRSNAANGHRSEGRAIGPTSGQRSNPRTSNNNVSSWVSLKSLPLSPPARPPPLLEQTARRGIPSWVPVAILSADGTETRAYAAVYPLTSPSSSPPSPPPSTGDSAPAPAAGATVVASSGGGPGCGGVSGDGDGSVVELQLEGGRVGGGRGESVGVAGDGTIGEGREEGSIRHALWEFHRVDQSTCVSGTNGLSRRDWRSVGNGARAPITPQQPSPQPPSPRTILFS